MLLFLSADKAVKNNQTIYQKVPQSTIIGSAQQQSFLIN